MNKTVKRVIAGIVIAAVVCGGIYGGLRIYKGAHTSAVKVYPVDSIMNPMEWYTSDTKAYGSVQLEGIQTVYVSSTQTVKEVNVEVGDTVKKGDVLMTYDTTLSDIEIEKADIDLQQKKLDLSRAEKDLETLKKMRPSSGGGGGGGSNGGGGTNSEPESTPESHVTLPPEKTPVRLGGSGTKDDPYVYLWSTSDALTDNTLLHMFQPDGYNEQTGEADAESETSASEVAETAAGTVLAGFLRHAGFLAADVSAAEIEEGAEEGTETPDSTSGDSVSGTEETEEPETESADSEETSDVENPVLSQSTSAAVESGAEEADSENGPQDGSTEAITVPSVESDSSSAYDETGSTSGVNLTNCPNEVYVLLEIHEDDNREGTLLQEYGMHLIRVGQQVAVRLFNPTGNNSSESSESDVSSDGDAGDDLSGDDITDDTGGGDADYGGDDGGSADLPDTSDSSDGDASDTSAGGSDYEPIDTSASYTAAELEEMRKSTATEVRDLTLDVKLAEVTLRQMKDEAGDGSVRAKISGEVTDVLDPESALSSSQPCIKVSAGGGYKIPISVSELDVPNLEVGQSVTVSGFDDESAEFQGTIQSIATYPMSGGDSWGGGGNPNVSYYQCIVYVSGEDASFQEYDYVGVSYKNTSDSKVIEKMFVRSDNGGNYVYKENADGKLEKTYIRTGTQPDSSVIQVLGGISEEDYVAFPYGTDVTDGAPAEEASIDDLYGN